MKTLYDYLNDVITETYSIENRDLINYLNNKEFDPYEYWYDICQWIYDNGYVKKLKMQNKVEDANELFNITDANDFYKLPNNLQLQCKDYILQKVINNNPEEAPSYMHINLNDLHPLPRNTWLIHFTDNPFEIKQDGFKYGNDDITKLGLTTWYKKESKKYGGYNFAVKANSKDALNIIKNESYGKNAVLFQSSGIDCYHFADEENQVIFWGKYINPKDIIVLLRDNYEWQVIGYRNRNNNIEQFVVYQNSYENVIKWVMMNYQQYRKALFFK